MDKFTEIFIKYSWNHIDNYTYQKRLNPVFTSQIAFNKVNNKIILKISEIHNDEEKNIRIETRPYNYLLSRIEQIIKNVEFGDDLESKHAIEYETYLCALNNNWSLDYSVGKCEILFNTIDENKITNFACLTSNGCELLHICLESYGEKSYKVIFYIDKTKIERIFNDIKYVNDYVRTLLYQ